MEGTIPKKAVVLARGLGKRMRAANDNGLTEDQRKMADAGLKALVPLVGSRTMLELVLSRIREAGFKEICLVIGPEHAAIREFCMKHGLSVSFAIQARPLGTADAVLAAEGFADGELFLTVNSDNLYPLAGLRRLKEMNGPAMLAFDREALIEKSNITAERIAGFAVIETDESGKLSRIVEKPLTVDPAARVSMNAWIFPPGIFEACRAVKPSERGELELTSAVQYAVTNLGVRFSAISCADGVLDLSGRGDIAAVSRRLRDEGIA